MHQSYDFSLFFFVDVFLCACRDLEIEVIQTLFEADAYIASLSSKLCCPLLSNDSDFFVQRNIDIISLSSLDFVPTSKRSAKLLASAPSEAGIVCRRFNQQRFCDHYGIADPRLLHLMSSVVGNDYVPVKTFERFFAQVRKPKKKSVSPRHKVMEGILSWIGREKDVDGAIEKIMDTIPKNERQRLRAKIASSMCMYVTPAVTDDRSSPVTSFDRKTVVPDWLLDGFKSGSFPHWFMDILFNRFAILHSQVEEVAEESSHLFASPILRHTCELLTSEDQDNLPRAVQVYVRVWRTLKYVRFYNEGTCRRISTFKEKTAEENENYLYDLISLPSELRQRLKEAACGDGSMKLFLLGLFFWTNRAKVPVLYIKVLAFGLFAVKLRSEQEGKINEKVHERLRRFETTPQDLKDGRRNVCLAFVKSLSRLQSVIYHLQKLSLLLNIDTLGDCRPWRAWNGTFLFNVHGDLQGFRDGNRIEACLEFDSSLITSFYALFDLMREFTVDLIPNIQFQGRRRLRSKKRVSDVLVTSELLENKFSALALSDDGSNCCSDTEQPAQDDDSAKRLL